MADQKVSDLPSLNGADVDAADLLYIIDSSAGAAGSKKITIGQYQLAPVSGGTANTVVYLNGSKVESSSSALTFDGTNLGIGTSSPGASIQTGDGSQAAREIRTSTTAAAGAGGFLRGYRAGSPSYYVGDLAPISGGSGGGFAAYVYGANPFVVYTNGNEGMRLDSSGNLGLGVTPSAWSSDYKPIQLGINGSVYGRVATTAHVGIAANGYRNAGGTWTYLSTATASRYDQDSGQHYWYTAPSGTAGNAITFTQAMTLDASGNLLLQAAASNLYIQPSTTTNNALTRAINAGGTAYIGLDSNAGGLGGQYSLNLWHGGNYPIVFATNNTERARITSGGDLLVGKTAADFTVAGAEIKPAGNIELTRNSASNCIQINKKGNTGDLLAFYYNDSSVVGTITNSSTNTAYNTSSDRRLKENIAPADDAGAVIDAIEVVQHDWKVGGHTRFGVVAQDLNAVAPEAVSAGDDGDEIERTWGVDYSKLVPMLIKEIQTLRARVAALEAK